MQKKINYFVFVLSKILDGNEWKTGNVYCEFTAR